MTQTPAKRILIVELDQHHPISTGAVDYARDAGWSVMFMSPRGRDLGDLARRWKADGAIIWGDWQSPQMKESRGKRIPRVWLPTAQDGGRYPPGGVLPDFHASGRLAAEHFIDAGFRHLAYCWLGDLPALNEQSAGFREAADAAGATLHPLDLSQRTGKASGSYYDMLCRWLVKQVRALPKPLGLMVDSDWTGVEVTRTFREAGILVPEEVGIVACYNMERICQGAPVPLSSVDTNWYAQGFQAAAMLGRLMDGEEPPAKPLRITPIGVVVRVSSDVIAMPHAGVATAMNLIREHFSDPELSVQRMAAAAGISTVMLNAAFKKHLGHPPGWRLRQWRLRQAMRLLETTRRSVKEIASACGYGRAEHLINNVKKATGLTPHRWRKQQQAQDPEAADRS